MRKVVLYHLMSLDGVAYEDGDWLADDGPQLVAYLGRVIATQDDVLMGRGTYDYWAGHWPTSDFQPFADFINGARKHVVTSTTPAQEWAHATRVTTPVPEYVAALKRESGGDIGVHGSIELARSLLRAGLVDELRLVVAPAVVGRGRRVFEGDGVQPWKLLEVDRGRNGTLFLDYGR
ncbi:Bifunctional deaminase-reductase domain protein [[Actinomadura] parvosata subsp. kistnae]|uniref:Deaminase n=1 Tax=[Actinomadura] parvosata subsp. kistnae TaxID=1909395 RepID=A0A1V0AJK6_9ACTN|nr:dihydrofolate reductase family protein [Nonomuraea sp. ATCC 55076]AQZ70414.1 deaminase [Nonomuraea sp. ATCC 55076]SPL88996.1 Bifunctional deaminase-reductase domain protein [Actinomadura parvosata subsp. kistnae]